MAENFKILDQILFDYVNEEVLKRYPNFNLTHSSLGQGKLAREERSFKVWPQSEKNFIQYYQGKISLHVDETFNSKKIAKDGVIYDNGKWYYMDTITHEAGNREQSDAAVLDAILSMIKFYLSLTQPIQKNVQDVGNDESICKEQIVDTIKLETTTLKNLLGLDEKDPFRKQLSLPPYQRAYEWQDNHVKALLDDTYEAFTKKKTYILGTIILHQNKEGGYEIVDGQQRLVTLSILFNDKLKENTDSLLNSEFDDLKSQYYIQNTNEIIDDYLKNKDRDNYLDYLQSENVTISVLCIPNGQLSLAFTFFDSLNSKGMQLSDYDLLKAHHLMFIPENQENLARKHNDEWQSKDGEHNELFEKILRQIRVWSRGHGEEGGGERLVYNEFVSAIDEKDLDKDEHVLNRYMQPNVFRSWNRENDQIVLNMRYPSQNVEDLIPMEIPQTIEGGDAFFLYAKRYHKMYELLFGEQTGEKKSSAIHYADELSKAIRNDYLRNAYKAIILLYFDKFGDQNLIELATCVELLLSTLRFPKAGGQTFVRQGRVKQYVNEQKIIPIILNSSYHSHVLSQLKNKIGNTPFEADRWTKNSQENYKADMLNFYNRHIHILHNDSIKLQVNHLYQRNQKQEENGNQ